MFVLAIVTTLTCLSIVAVGLRLWSRFRIVKSPGLDDCTIVAALIADIVFFAFVIVEIKHGLGKTQATLTDRELQIQLKALWLSIPIYNLSLILTKISIMLLYLRLFPHQWFINSTKITLVVLILFGLWAVISGFLFCIPVKAFWDLSVKGKCLPNAPVWLFNASMNIATDLAILLLPMPVLTTLNLPWRQKVAVILIFGIGVFVCVTSIVRVVHVVDLINGSEISKQNGPAAAWSSIEANVAILCACLPALRPILARLFPRLLPGWNYYARNKKPTREASDLFSIYQGGSGRYSASVTGPGHAEEQHLPPEGDRIKVVKELRMESDLAECADMIKLDSERLSVR